MSNEVILRETLESVCIMEMKHKNRNTVSLRIKLKAVKFNKSQLTISKELLVMSYRQ